MSKEIYIDLGNLYSEIETPILKSVLEEIKDCCSYNYSSYDAGSGFKKDFQMSLFNEHNKNFPTGLYQRVVSRFKELGYKTKIRDNRLKPDINVEDVISKIHEFGLAMRDYQIDGALEGIDHPNGLFNWSTGCHRINQKVMMYSGKFKKVQNIKKNDLLMGPDSLPRKVLRLIRGKGKMYEVNPVKGKSWIVNEDHILTLKLTGKGGSKRYLYKEIIDVSIKDYMQWSKHRKHLYKLFKVPVNFTEKDIDINLPIDPYFLGVLLGDGSIWRGINVTTMDNRIATVCKKIAKRYGLLLRKEIQIKEGIRNKSSVYHFHTGIKGPKKNKNPENEIKTILKKLKVFGNKCGNKFIPPIFKRSSRKQRLQILAGLLDTDGWFAKDKNYYGFGSKSKKLAYDVAFISRSLGFASYVKKVRKKCSNSIYGTIGTYYGVSICGDVDEIPCKLKRKKAHKRKQKKNVLCNGFTLRELDNDNYYGFTLDGNGRYLLDDFTVTHNSGKTVLFIFLLLAYDTKTLILVNRKELMEQIAREISEITGRSVGMIGDGIWNPSKWTVGIVNTLNKGINSNSQGIRSRAVNYLKSVKYFMGDEIHHLGAKTWKDIVRHCENAYARHGFSGTCFHPDSEDLYLVAFTGEIISEVTSDYLIHEGWLARPYIYMPRIMADSDLHASNNWHETRRVFIRENDRVNESGVKFINKMYNKGISCIYFVGSDVAYGNRIKDMILDVGVSPRDIKFMTGKESSDTRRKVLNDFKERRIQILGGTTIYDEGVDVPHTGAGVNFGQGYSDINTVQRIGRVLRKTKPDNSIDIDPKDKQIKYYWDPINLGNSITEKHSNFRKNLYEGRKEFRVHEREYGSGSKPNKS